MAAVKRAHFKEVCPERPEEGVETSKEHTVAWADIAISGNRSPWSDGTAEVEADHQSIQAGYGD